MAKGGRAKKFFSGKKDKASSSSISSSPSPTPTPTPTTAAASNSSPATSFTTTVSPRPSIEQLEAGKSRYDQAIPATSATPFEKPLTADHTALSGLPNLGDYPIIPVQEAVSGAVDGGYSVPDAVTTANAGVDNPAQDTSPLTNLAEDAVPLPAPSSSSPSSSAPQQSVVSAPNPNLSAAPAIHDDDAARVESELARVASAAPPVESDSGDSSRVKPETDETLTRTGSSGEASSSLQQQRRRPPNPQSETDSRDGAPDFTSAVGENVPITEILNSESDPVTVTEVTLPSDPTTDNSPERQQSSDAAVETSLDGETAPTAPVLAPASSALPDTSSVQLPVVTNGSSKISAKEDHTLGRRIPSTSPVRFSVPLPTLESSAQSEPPVQSSSSAAYQSLPGSSSTSPTQKKYSHSRTNSTSYPQYRRDLSPTAPIPSHPPPTPKSRPTLLQTVQDLKSLFKLFLVLLPSSLHPVLGKLTPRPIKKLFRLILHLVAKMLHQRGTLASSLFYDLMVFFWKTLINIFFREIRSRGSWKVPREGEGAVIFVVGPHHNQFLDPLLLMSEVRREAGRRISFLVAEKSMNRKFIGQAAKLMQSISVARAQDMASPGKGHISVDPNDPCIIIGYGSSFTTELAPRKQLMLPKSLGNVTVEVVEVLDDNRCRVKKEFKEKVIEQLRGEKYKNGSVYKVLPYVDQTRMYSSVYQKLKEGGCIGIFPEGGSHDRTDLLPLKAGVSIMALGALSANPELKLRIVPVGLSYFHPHRFRSRAVVEFGTPIEIESDFVDKFQKGGDLKKEAIGGVMELVVDGLKSVTVRAPDYETLMLIQATRRLYRPPGQHLTLGQIVELNKRFVAGYEVYKDEPRLKDLSTKVKDYNTLLRYMGLKDHQIDRVARPLWRSLILLAYRIGLFSAWGILALPGVVLNAPIFLAASIISRAKAREALAASTVKIKGNDVLATWKVLVALAGAPALYGVYATGATVLAFRYDLPTKYKIYAPISTAIGLPLIGYSALKFGEVGMDVYKSLRPLFLSVVPGNVKQLDRLRTMRTSLQEEINEIVNEFGPQLFEDFESTRIIPPTSRPPPIDANPGRRRSTYGPKGEGTFLTHPMSWLDEYLFGWTQSQSEQQRRERREYGSHGEQSDGTYSEGNTHSGYVSGYTTDEAPDYDEVIHILSREQGLEHVASGTTPSGPQSESGSIRYRRVSRSRSRSQLDLTALNASIENQAEGGGGVGGNNSKALRNRQNRGFGFTSQEDENQ